MIFLLMIGIGAAFYCIKEDKKQKEWRNMALDIIGLVINCLASALYVVRFFRVLIAILNNIIYR